MSDDLSRRVDASLELLGEFLARGRSLNPVDSRLLTMAHDGVAAFALGGKHLRSRLVHISAGEVTGERLYAATVFGACVDLLHGAFLIHDDIIDRDDVRRGLPTIHAAVREEFGDAHLGIAVAITAGDLGINGAIQLLLDSGLDDALVRRGLGALSAAAQETITGEILDISHTVPTTDAADGTPDPELVRLSNRLKTSEYSFGTPLKLGAIAAGRDPEPMAGIAHELGCAYQAADDIAGTVGESADTGKQAAGDVVNGRATLMTMRMDGDVPADPARLAEIVGDVVAEGEGHLARARTRIDAAGLEPGIREGLHHITDQIEGMLHAYA
ncbi:polyprenyl synthetase family protein [Corynebacterium halotolerans]|uniref:Geranylgeranyl pyrophosphate synthase n=1 Tax=Corynebacterium halotolerans YIM 70093 = DSM 44683 TaxID=1121362 RepID=M1NJY2_9CORY|nr:polyprenyl synthetase family protein [Corynebacterium halotolerans]AGF71713.1 geranylgeranyl pyrophosphate synthase [Corynebacterium halotolerans YIM 70093 = DSM 44683]